MSEKDKYTKIVYQSNPIGKDKIILYLTTFDLEAFEKDEKMEKIPIKRIAYAIDYSKHELNDINIMESLERRMEYFINSTYGEQLEKMKDYIEVNRKIPEAKWIEIGEQK